jgi:hypothetical protein
MFGYVFRISLGKEDIMTVVVSFGGLLMELKGDKKHFNKIKIDSVLFLLIRT